MLSVSLRLLCHGGFLYVTVCLSISGKQERGREIPTWMWNNSERGSSEKDGGGGRVTDKEEKKRVRKRLAERQT